MKTLYSAKLVKDTFRVGDNNYRAVEMFEENGEKFYALQDIRNGGTTLFAVSMEEIMDFIGEDYELVTVVATYETCLSLYARYILPQTVDMWKATWENEMEHEKFLVDSGKYSLEKGQKAMKHMNDTNNKIDEIFSEFKYVRDAIFQENLAEKSYQDIVKLLPDYKLEETGYSVKKRINEHEYFAIFTSDYDNDDDVEYEIDEGYGEYFQAVYYYSDGNTVFSLNLAQRHHHFFFMWA